MIHDKYGVHIALAKYPLGEVDNYIRNIGHLYSSYKNDIKQYLSCNEDFDSSSTYLNSLYNPKAFHLFSQFDVAFISLIDSYKFTQRVFEPKTIDQKNKVHKNVSYQIISGSLISGKSKNQVNRILNKKESFINIIQLKLSNGLIIGAGDLVLKSVINFIKSLLDKHGVKDYFIVDSFNWSEIVLIIVDKTPKIITKVLLELRLLKLESIENYETILDESLYKSWKEENIEKAHIFNDTNSYLGVDYNSIKNNKIDNNLEFNTRIDWQIKPGHLPYFLKHTNSFLHKELDEIKFIYGKTDFVLNELTPDKFQTNQLAFSEIRDNSKLRMHIRKIRTNIFVDLDKSVIELYTAEGENEFIGPCSSEKNLSAYVIDKDGNTARYLRGLNISRNIRKKVRKLIYNFNQGIQDPVLFIYYLDIRSLLAKFVKIIENRYKILYESLDNGEIDIHKIVEEDSMVYWPYQLKTKFLEDLINKYVIVFEEALQDRVLNSYNFEDLNEFSLDINSSSTSLLSSYDSIVKVCGKCFRDFYSNSLVTRINDVETISNSISVNYNIDHINCPPLVFSTLIKEVLNTQKMNDVKENREIFDRLKNKYNDIASDFLNAEAIRLTGIQNLEYYEIDIKKFYLTFFQNEELFTFWHWTYALQNTSSYSSFGNFDEYNFIRELFRYLLMAVSLKFGSEDEAQIMECPLPELKTYWDRHFNKLLIIVKKITSLNEFNDWKNNLTKQTYHSLYEIDIAKPLKARRKEVRKLNLEKNYNSIYGIIDNYFHKKNEYGIIELKELSLEEFISQFEKLRADQRGQSNNLDKISNISVVSYYSLTYIYLKFEKHIKLLRRDYTNGKPVNHFLDRGKWFIDPMGGFFVNSPHEREDYNQFNNCILSIIWGLGVNFKKDQLI
ncbi:hypothetical protein AB9K26_14430 [Psychroserpens sp. XS_ASV72]|uniref:hypothetical protein n=1 Tax=Psychroserpens sp. XS_ASV72 TaxID=3241293 RepID=UPI003516385C